MTTINDRLTKILCEHLGTTEEKARNPDAHIIDDIGADSLDIVEIVMAVEEAFNIEIPDAEMETIGTIGSLAALIERLAPPTA